MLYMKFQGNQPSGSGEENFLKVFTIYGHGSRLGHVTLTKEKKNLSRFACRLHVEFKSRGKVL